MTATIPASPALPCARDCALAADDAEALRRLAEAVAADDIDTAITLGLLDGVPAFGSADDAASMGTSTAQRPCMACMDNARQVSAARDARMRALAARERHRAREARLRRRAEARASRGAVAALPADAAMDTTASADAMPAPSAAAIAPATRPALPPSAAAALARAKARASARGTKE